MAIDALLAPETLTALSAFLAALFAGVVAIIAELRKPARQPPARPPEDAPNDDDASVVAVLHEEIDHLTRTVWIVEKRLSDQLRRIEVALARAEGRAPPPTGSAADREPEA